VAGERAVVGASTAGDRGQEVRDELTGGDGGTEGESGREGGGNGADSSGPRGRERGRGVSALVGADRRDPPVRHRGCAGWAKWADLG
jgi:hypothetical protein